MMEQCEHLHTIPTRFVKSNGVACVKFQCQDCWQPAGDGKNKDYDLDMLPLFDKEKREEYWRERGRQCTADYEREQERRRAEWFADYDAYLASPHWAKLRRSVLVRDGFLCQGCFRKITDATAHVHHLSYDAYNRLGYSFAFECVALCPECHDQYHGKRKPTYDEIARLIR